MSILFVAIFSLVSCQLQVVRSRDGTFIIDASTGAIIERVGNQQSIVNQGILQNGAGGLNAGSIQAGNVRSQVGGVLQGGRPFVEQVGRIVQSNNGVQVIFPNQPQQQPQQRSGSNNPNQVQSQGKVINTDPDINQGGKDSNIPVNAIPPPAAPGVLDRIKGILGIGSSSPASSSSGNVISKIGDILGISLPSSTNNGTMTGILDTIRGIFSSPGSTAGNASGILDRITQIIRNGIGGIIGGNGSIFGNGQNPGQNPGQTPGQPNGQGGINSNPGQPNGQGGVNQTPGQTQNPGQSPNIPTQTGGAGGINGGIGANNQAFPTPIATGTPSAASSADKLAILSILPLIVL